MGRSYAKKSGFRIPVPAMLAPLLQLLKSPKLTNLLKGAPHVLPNLRLTSGSGGYGSSNSDGKKQMIQSAGGSISVGNMGVRKLHPSFARTSVNAFLVNGGFRCTTAVGKQAAFNLVVPFNLVDTSSIRGFVNASATTRVCYKEAYSTIQLTNQDNGNVLITLYDVIAKRSGTTDPVATWAAGTTSGGSALQQTVVSCDPSTCNRFNDFWHIKKVYQFWLGAGESHCHILKYNPNMQISGEVQDITAFIAGLAHGCMMVVSGAPYNDVTTKTQVSTGSSAVDAVVSIGYKYTFISDTTSDLSTTNSLPNFTVGENIMNENTGTATADAQA